MEETLVNVLYGGRTSLRHCCGYCKRKGKYLTVKQMKKHECLAKQCQYLDKVEHRFWELRDKKLALKKANKKGVIL